MANRVSVGINVNDNSRRALAQLRSSMQRTSRDIRRSGGTVDFRVNVRPGTSRAELRRIQRSLRGMPVTINTRLDPPPVRTVRQRITRALAGFRATINTRLNAPPGAARRALLRRLGQLFTVPVRLAFRGGRGVLRGIFRPLAAFIGGILNDGIGQGILGAFRSAGPAGVAVLAGAIIAGISLIGAALAATLVFAFGAAFVGLAAYIAVESGRVTKQWDATLKRLAEKFKGAAEPIIPVIEHAIELMEKLGNSFAPHFKQAIAEAAPSVTVFLDSVAEGIKKFGKRAFGPMMKGFDAFLLAFGPEFESFMEGLGDAFGNLGRTASRHSGEIAIALRMVLGLITTLVDIVNFFANAWAMALRGIHYGLGLLLDALARVVQGFFWMVDKILGGLESISSVIGLDGPIRRAKDNMRALADDTVGKLQRMAQGSKDWGLNMDRANKTRRLQVDITSLQAKLKQARQDLANTANKKAKAKVQANIDQLNNALNRARDKLAALNGYTVQTYVDTWHRNKGYGGNSVTGGRATGGVIGAAATGGVRRNMTLVGEQGPELVDLPGGSRVRSNSDSRRLAGSGGGGGGPAVIRIEAGRDDISQMLLKILRSAIRVQGGNVQIVLGKGGG